jgi:hypothetical protein
MTTSSYRERLCRWFAASGRKHAIHLGVALLLVVVIRGTVAQTFAAPVPAPTGEIPAGARVLVWKLASQFDPGDIIVFRDPAGRAMFGRIVRADDPHLIISRDGEPDRTVARVDVVGRVVLNTR